MLPLLIFNKLNISRQYEFYTLAAVNLSPSYTHGLAFIRIFDETQEMKTRVNLTVEIDVLKKAKNYAEEHNTSVSEMVEEYLKKVTKRSKKEMPYFLKVLDKWEPKENYIGRNLKKEYYETKGKRHGY